MRSLSMCRVQRPSLPPSPVSEHGRGSTRGGCSLILSKQVFKARPLILTLSQLPENCGAHAMSWMREIRTQNSCALSSCEPRKIALPKLNDGANR